LFTSHQYKSTYIRNQQHETDNTWRKGYGSIVSCSGKLFWRRIPQASKETWLDEKSSGYCILHKSNLFKFKKNLSKKLKIKFRHQPEQNGGLVNPDWLWTGQASPWPFHHPYWSTKAPIFVGQIFMLLAKPERFFLGIQKYRLMSLVSNNQKWSLIRIFELWDKIIRFSLIYKIPGPPSAPGQPLVQNFTSQAVEISWSRSISHPDAPVLLYRIYVAWVNFSSGKILNKYSIH